MSSVLSTTDLDTPEYRWVRLRKILWQVGRRLVASSLYGLRKKRVGIRLEPAQQPTNCGLNTETN